MFTRMMDIYRQNLWFRITLFVGLLLSTEILFWASGGFPPWAWRFLFQVVPQLSLLWGEQGAAILIPLLGLLLLSLALLLMWLIILICLWKVLMSFWHGYAARQDFESAEQLAEQMFEHGLAQQGPPHAAQAVAGRYSPSGTASDGEQAVRPARASAQAARSTRASSQPTRPDPDTTRPARISSQPTRPEPETARPAALTYRPAEAEVDTESFEEAWQPRAARPLFPQHEARPYAVARASRQVRAAAAGQNYYAPAAPPANPAAPRREGLRIVPREAAYKVPEQEEEEGNYETLFEIEHPLIKTSGQRRTESAEDVHTDSLREAVHTEELEGTLRFVVGIGLDAGIARKHAPNEDNLFAIQSVRPGKHGTQPVGLFLVADGMGGHADGQEASRMATQIISDTIVPAIMRLEADEDNFADLLKDAVHRANLALYQRNRDRSEMMGTTVTAALLIENQVFIANVGDSRTYLYRPTEGLKQITRDHSVVAQLVEEGHLTREEIYTHPRRNQIYRCLGEKASIEIDSFQVAVQPRDVLLLCSDGLWEMVRDKAIQQIIAGSATHPSQISSMLVQSALSRGGADNISLVVVCVMAPEEG